jgi:Tfp pilus assembly protein PilO
MNRRAPLIAALVGVGLIILVIVALILPKASAVRSKQAEVTQAQAKEQQLRLQLQQLQAAVQQAGQLRKQETKLAAEVPPTADLPGIIRLLNSTAIQAGVDFISIGPAQPVPAPDGTTSSIPTQITVNGGFFSVDRFLSLLETLSRVVKVTQIQVARGGVGSGQLSLVMSAEFYTTDTSAGPGSVSAQGGGTTVPVPTVSPSASPTPSASPGG